ncbi:SulP family inorganic anion transporter, partial [Mycobacterium sp. E2462]|uniref:SulP family inorganic anion transporter n=1 Tax=Mycobacterium sp. E2462 TaxID=1834133 RepID=UPI000A54590A
SWPRTDFNRELIGQGAANMVSGAIGGLPIAGVIVRSAANVSAGARSRASTVMHGFWVLLFAVPFAGLVEKIPTAALAGLLIVIGIELLKPAHIETAMRNGDFAVYLITVVSVVFLNLLHGVLIGLAVAVAVTGWRVVRAKVQATVVGAEWHVVVEGACTFLALPRLTGVLASIPEGTDVTVHLSATYLDHSARQAITDWQRQHSATGGAVRIHEQDSTQATHTADPATPRRAAHLNLVAAGPRPATETD